MICRDEMRRCLFVFATAVASLALVGVLEAQTTNAGTPVLTQAQIERAEQSQQIEQNKAGLVNDLLSQWASEAASRGYDAYWQKGQRNLLGLGADELMALSEKAKDFETFDKLVFGGFKLNALGDLTQELVYYPLAPCRLLDTRIGTGAFAGPKAPATEVAFSVNDTLTPQGGLAAGCGVPGTDPPALSVVITAVPTDLGQGNLRAYPTGGTIPTASVVNYQGGVVVAAGTISRSASGTSNELTVRNQGAGTTHIVVDVTGYFAPATFPILGRAYAKVFTSATPTFDAARTKGFASVTQAATGVFCLNFTSASLSAATAPVIVTPEWDSSLGFDLLAYHSAGAFECPAGTDVGVRTYQFAAGGAPVLSNNVDFYVWVP